MNPLFFLLPAYAAVVVLASPHSVARRHALAGRAVANPDDTFPLERRKKGSQSRSSSLSKDMSQTPAVNAGNPPSAQNPSRSRSPTPTRNDPPPNMPTPPPKGIAHSGGRATFYHPSVGLGACGFQRSDNEFVAAISHSDFDPSTPNNNPNRNPLCNKMISVTFQQKNIAVQLVDRCGDCNSGGIDLSPVAFQALAPTASGVLSDVTWRVL